MPGLILQSDSRPSEKLRGFPAVAVPSVQTSRPPLPVVLSANLEDWPASSPTFSRGCSKHANRLEERRFRNIPGTQRWIRYLQSGWSQTLVQSLFLSKRGSGLTLHICWTPLRWEMAVGTPWEAVGEAHVTCEQPTTARGLVLE